MLLIGFLDIRNTNSENIAQTMRDSRKKVIIRIIPIHLMLKDSILLIDSVTPGHRFPGIVKISRK